MKQLILAASFLVAATGLAQQSPAGLTLRELTDEALAASPAVAGVTARRDMAEARLREARSMWLPRVDASAALTESDNPVFVFGSLLEQGRFGQQPVNYLGRAEFLRNKRASGRPQDLADIDAIE